jgi:hypothetical protein
MFFRIDQFTTAETCRQKAADLRQKAATANGQSGCLLTLANSWDTLAMQYEHLDEIRARVALSLISEDSTLH